MKDLLLRIQRSRKCARALKLLSHLVSFVSVAAFGYMVYLSLSESVTKLMELLAVLALPFLAVTILRRLLNAPRPYELYDFYGEAPKNKKGSSFPSRHAHSAFAIGTLLCIFSPPLGAALLFLAIPMCTSRVLLGIHFPRDVIAGALTGTLSSVIGIFIVF